jgi:L-ascorbate metabolism protein UlaG (beta-lactamase superfamily)
MTKVSKWLLTTTWFLFLLSFSLISPPAGISSNESKPSQPDATIWYLGHCGYAIKTPNHLLVFDYIELEEDPSDRGLDRGFVDPLEIADQNVTVFVTHSHVDHYDKIILSWQDKIQKIRYVFGWQMDEGPGRYSLPGPRDELQIEGLRIYTVNSHHSGVPEVAFLVQADGLTLFHGGDYQGRMARGEPSNAAADMRHLKTKVNVVDLLFIGAWTGDPYLDVLRGLEPRVIFPMHDRKREERYITFAEDLRKLGFTQPVVCPTKRGDHFKFRDVIPHQVVPAEETGPTE